MKTLTTEATGALRPASQAGSFQLAGMRVREKVAGRREFSTEFIGTDNCPWNLCTWQPSQLPKASCGKVESKSFYCWTWSCPAPPGSHVSRWGDTNGVKQQLDSGEWYLSPNPAPKLLIQSVLLCKFTILVTSKLSWTWEGLCCP